MGILFSRYYSKPSTRDTLEKIEQEIQNIEERRWDKIKREQFVVQILSFLPIAILITIVCILIYPSESSWRDKLLLSVPIGIINLILWVSKRIVQWYSRWSLDNEEVRLRKLRKEKKKILEMVCETESYRVATELLEKYDPKQLRRREKEVDAPTTPSHNTTLTKFTASAARSPSHHNQTSHSISHHQITSPMSHNQTLSFPVQTPIQSVPAPPPPTPITKPSNVKSNQVAQLNSSILNASTTGNVAASSVQGRPVRPILSKDRTIFEKVVDWVVADGPDNRFALICRYCYGHNGMSLAEEYETINFRCCYCYNLNTAAHKRQIHDQLQPDREKSSKTPSTKTTSKIDELNSTITNNDDTLIDSKPTPDQKKEKGKKAKNKTVSEKVSETKTADPVVEQIEAKDDVGDKHQANQSDQATKQVEATENMSK